MTKRAEWENITKTVISDKFSRYVDRLKVSGGWLVNSATTYKESQVCESMCFVPDPEHKWEIE